MHCFACNRLLVVGEGHDPVTNRFYCSQCFEPTIEEQFRLANKDYIPPEDEYEDVPEEYQLESTPRWTEEDENDYPF